MPIRVSSAFQSGVCLSSTDRSVVAWLTIFCTVALNNKMNEFIFYFMYYESNPLALFHIDIVLIATCFRLLIVYSIFLSSRYLYCYYNTSLYYQTPVHTLGLSITCVYRFKFKLPYRSCLHSNSCGWYITICLQGMNRLLSAALHTGYSYVGRQYMHLRRLASISIPNFRIAFPCFFDDKISACVCLFNSGVVKYKEAVVAGWCNGNCSCVREIYRLGYRLS